MSSERLNNLEDRLEYERVRRGDETLMMMMMMEVMIKVKEQGRRMYYEVRNARVAAAASWSKSSTVFTGKPVYLSLPSFGSRWIDPSVYDSLQDFAIFNRCYLHLIAIQSYLIPLKKLPSSSSRGGSTSCSGEMGAFGSSKRSLIPYAKRLRFLLLLLLDFHSFRVQDRRLQLDQLRASTPN